MGPGCAPAAVTLRCVLPQGLVTLLILPIANAANQHLQPDDTYWKLNVTQVRFRIHDRAVCGGASSHAHIKAGQGCVRCVSTSLSSLQGGLSDTNHASASCRLWCCCRCSASVR